MDGMTGGNGSPVEDGGEVIMQLMPTGAQCRSVADWLEARGIPFYRKCNSGLFGSAGFKTSATDADPCVQ